LSKHIDEFYEKSLIEELYWLPETMDKDLIIYLEYFKIFIKNIDLINLSNDLKSLHNPPSFSFNIRDVIASNVKHDLTITPKNRAQILNVVAKFSPIFICFEELMKHPVKYIDRYNEKDDNQIL
jgi:hypothetical protein